MKRSRRQLVLVWGLFLCLGAVILVFWLRSYFGCETFTIARSRALSASFSRGLILLNVTRWEIVSGQAVGNGDGRGSGWSVRYSRSAAANVASWPTNACGFGKYDATWENMWHMSTIRRTEAGIVLPFWLPTCLITMAVFWQLRPRKQHRAEGNCQNCGYDLCRTPERCPECGRLTRP